MSDLISAIDEAFGKFESCNVHPKTFMINQSRAEFLLKKYLAEKWGEVVDVKIIPNAYNTDGVFYLLPEEVK